MGEDEYGPFLLAYIPFPQLKTSISTAWVESPAQPADWSVRPFVCLATGSVACPAWMDGVNRSNDSENDMNEVSYRN
jgi:hypothetical protein